jgi:hypothetical protein
MEPTHVPARPVACDRALLAAYGEASKAVAGVMEFRGKLLALLPLASGAGIFLLLVADARNAPAEYLFAAGLFGCVVTLGLYFHELYSIRWCDELFECGKRIEERLLLAATEQGLPDPKLGPFRTAPDEFAGYVSARGAALIIYPATMSAWTYLAVARTKLAGPGSLWVWMIPALVMVTFVLIGWATIRTADTPKQPSDASGRNRGHVA